MEHVLLSERDDRASFSGDFLVGMSDERVGKEEAITRSQLDDETEFVANQSTSTVISGRNDATESELGFFDVSVGQSLDGIFPSDVDDASGPSVARSLHVVRQRISKKGFIDARSDSA